MRTFNNKPNRKAAQQEISSLSNVKPSDDTSLFDLSYQIDEKLVID
jgi:hypothetical protein